MLTIIRFVHIRPRVGLRGRPLESDTESHTNTIAKAEIAAGPRYYGNSEEGELIQPGQRRKSILEAACLEQTLRIKSSYLGEG